ncbi:site-specific DNA-methyltransferase [Sutcliffiella cohnii]
MAKKTKLELTWIGKENPPKLEPRILLEDSTKSYHANKKITENDIFDNRLIFGDNLLALKALEQEFTGKIKCIYIDPPYNTGNAFEHYDDGVEHSLWLSLMKPRLEILRNLLSDDGSIWISIDDDEQAYLKILCDEIFGRRNFVANVIWQKKFSPQNDSKWLSDSHDFIMVYAKNKENWRPNQLPRNEKMNSRYKNPDNDPRGAWTSGDILRKDVQKSGLYTIVTPSGRVCNPPTGRSWRFSEANYLKLVSEGRIWFGADGQGVPRIKRYITEVKQGVTPMTIWSHEEVGHNQEAQKEVRQFNNDDPFSTPKPERLIERILTIATNKDDLVLDSFAGSGTTGSVAQKMGRRWIMIELGEHCHTHIIPRLKKVIDGTDQGGISKAVDWKGGGGYRYFRLAPSLLEKDRFGNWVISKEYNPTMLAEAMCKLKGFSYQPDETIYWKQGKSTENDYIYITTQLISREIADQIFNQLGEEETLLICCKAFNLNQDDYPNITFEKIPTSILKECEYGRDDYSLEIAALPKEEQAVQMEMFEGEVE